MTNNYNLSEVQNQDDLGFQKYPEKEGTGFKLRIETYQSEWINITTQFLQSSTLYKQAKISVWFPTFGVIVILVPTFWQLSIWSMLYIYIYIYTSKN